MTSSNQMCISKITLTVANFDKLGNAVNGILKTTTVLKTKVEQLETRHKSLVLWKQKEERTIYHHDKRDLSDAGYHKDIENSYFVKSV